MVNKYYFNEFFTKQIEFGIKKLGSCNKLPSFLSLFLSNNEVNYII